MPAKELEDLLEKAALDPVYQAAFYETLLRSELIALYHPEPNSPRYAKQHVLKEATPINFVTFQLDTGQFYVPIFTSLEAVQKGIVEEVPYLQMEAKTLLPLFTKISCILNPFSQYAKEFLPGEIADFLRGFDVTVPANTKFLIGQPKNYPEKLLETLSEYFSSVTDVQAAYLIQIFQPNSNNPPHMAICLNMLKENKTIMHTAGNIAKIYLNPNEIIDFIQVGWDDEFIKDTPPFYFKLAN